MILDQVADISSDLTDQRWMDCNFLFHKHQQEHLRFIEKIKKVCGETCQDVDRYGVNCRNLNDRTVVKSNLSISLLIRLLI